MRTSFLLMVIPLATSLFAQDPPRIWGMTPSGGANNKGTVFSVNLDGTDFATVFDFDDASGWGPEGGFCLAPNGLLYGMTTFGGEGAPAVGTLFTIDPSTGAFEKLRDFNLGNGGYNWGSLIVATDGMLYGAGYAGSDGGGSIFRVDPATNEYMELYALDQATDGAAITGVLVQAADGRLYGAASQGGVNNEAGTLFRYDPVTDVFTKLHDFDGAAGGRTPYGGLCDAGNGWFYGTTYEAGTSNNGTLYKYDPENDVFETLYNFADANGSNCWTGLLRVGPDLLLGTVANGGLNSGGFLYTVAPNTDAFAVVTQFVMSTGGQPVGNVASGPDGELFGFNTNSGTGFFGTLYRLDPSTFQPTILHHFTNGADGGMPRGEPILVSSTVGLARTAARSLFAVGPNPTAGQVTLRCDQASLPLQALITDALGRTLHTFTIAQPVTTIDLGDAPGHHFLTLTGASGRQTERVMVGR